MAAPAAGGGPAGAAPATAAAAAPAAPSGWQPQALPAAPLGEQPSAEASEEASTSGGRKLLYPPAQPAGDASPFWIAKYERDASLYWDRFYRSHAANFFKDRHYLLHEFPELRPTGRPRALLEAGCGAGNAALPLAAADPHAVVYCCDFSPRAVGLVRASPGFDPARVRPFVWDVAAAPLPQEGRGPAAVAAAASAAPVASPALASPAPGQRESAPAVEPGDTGGEDVRPPPSPVLLPAEGVSIITFVFALSAMSPPAMAAAARHAAAALATPDGRVLVRDYAAGDLAGSRLEAKALRRLGEDFFVRGDGTRAFYFREQMLVDLFAAAGLLCLDVRTIEDVKQNRKVGVVMARRWVQAVFGWGPGALSAADRHAAGLPG